jgi:hypothetical protein
MAKGSSILNGLRKLHLEFFELIKNIKIRS